MENFRELTYCKRKASCPLILMDQTQGKFQIYDREYQKQSFYQGIHMSTANSSNKPESKSD